MKTVSVAASAAMLISVAGCGSSTPEEAAGNEAAVAAPAAATDPCAFATKEEVSAATGETIIQAQADGDRCTYQTDDAMAASVEVELKPNGGAEEMEIARRATGVLADMGNEMKSAGGAEGDVGNAIASGGAAKLGDASFFGPNEQLHVLKGDVYFSVTPPTMRSRMSGGNPMLSADDKRKMATAVAERVLSKL